MNFPNMKHDCYKLCRVLEVVFDGKGHVRTARVQYRRSDQRDKPEEYQEGRQFQEWVPVQRLCLLFSTAVLIMKYWPQMTTLLVFRCLRLILLRIRLINFHIYNPVLRLSAEGALMRDDILLVTSWLLTRLATFGPYTPGSRLFDPKLPACCCYP